MIINYAYIVFNFIEQILKVILSNRVRSSFMETPKCTNYFKFKTDEEKKNKMAFYAVIIDLIKHTTQANPTSFKTHKQNAHKQKGINSLD